ncbi:MAG: phage major capsid protein [Actinomycetota bacterium]|nr:phage major capsid protein [Actinomycetota bacterium]
MNTDALTRDLRAARARAQEAWSEFAGARDAAGIEGKTADPATARHIERLHQGYEDAAEGLKAAEKRFQAGSFPSSGPTEPPPETGFPGGAGSWRTMGAPPLALSESAVRDLHKAAMAGRIETKVIDSTADPMATVAEYRLSPFPYLREQTRVLDYIKVQATQSPSVIYFRALAAASAAATVAEGADKPESSPTWESVTAPIRKVAHIARATYETVQDFDAFTSVLGQELLAGLIQAENDQLLNGNGTAPNLTGLLATTGILTRARGTEAQIETLFSATSDLRTGAAYTEPDVIILNPANWSTVRLTKDSTGRYLAGDPLDPAPSRLWSAPVVLTTQMPAGTGIVANLKLAATAYVRESPRVDTNPNGGLAEWKANIVLFRAEERLALAVERPKAIVKVTGL